MQSEQVSESSGEIVKMAENEAGSGSWSELITKVGEFNPNQVVAMEVLTSGGTITDAARAAGVTRRTMYAWLEEGHAFAAAYEQWKRSIAETSRTRLLMIGEAATVTVARAIKNGDTRAALAVVKGMGLLSPPAVGPSLTQTVARKKELEVSKAELEIGEKKKVVETFAQLVNVDGFSAEMRVAEGREGKLGGND